MWSIDDYATQVYQYASEEVCSHVMRTVLQPLGLTSSGTASAKEYFALFALPPCTTNVRLCGAALRERSLALQTTVKNVAEERTAQGVDTTYAPVNWLNELGLPYAAVVLPHKLVTSSSHLSICSPSPLSNTTQGLLMPHHAPRVLVCLDTGCAEAVLRGSDVYVAGVLASSHTHFEPNTPVLLLWLAQREAATHTVQAASVTAGSSLARTGILNVICPTTTQHCVNGEKIAEYADVMAVCVGEGIAMMDAKTMRQQGRHGMAVAVKHNPMMQPSQECLASLFGMTHEDDCDSDMPSLFLQNYSSMVPVQLLINRLVWDDSETTTTVPPCVVDACAAPGGKSSLLLSLLLEQSRDFRLVCCERSASRCAQLRRCLTRHFASSTSKTDLLARVLRVCAVDVNKLELHEDCMAVLLDPPCTGMGLRPRLLPHQCTLAQIAAAADYQRKLFDSCLRLLTKKCSPQKATRKTLVYSTCTITCEENEGNVLAFLTRYEHVRLARAHTAEERALCALSTTSYSASQGRRFLLQEEISAVQRRKERASDEACEAPLLVLRFMPRPVSQYTSPYEDGVGFFVAVFEVDVEA